MVHATLLLALFDHRRIRWNMHVLPAKARYMLHAYKSFPKLPITSRSQQM